MRKMRAEKGASWSGGLDVPVPGEKLGSEASGEDGEKSELQQGECGVDRELDFIKIDGFAR